MKTLTIAWIVLLASGIVLTRAAYGESRYQSAYAEWEAKAYGSFTGADVKAAFRELQTAWQAESDNRRHDVAFRYSQCAVRTARLLLDAGDIQAASVALTDAGTVATAYSIVPSRGMSPTAFQDMASAHVALVTALQKDPLKDLPIGYELFANGNDYIAVQETTPGSRSTSTMTSVAALDELSSTETTGTLLRLGSAGNVAESLPVALSIAAGKENSLRSRITAVYRRREPGPDGPGGFIRSDLSKLLNARNGNNSGESPAGRLGEENIIGASGRSPTRIITGEAMPAAARNESFWPWLIAGIIITAAAGLYWFLRRRE